MAKRRYNSADSFYMKVRLVLVLLAIIPFLLVIYTSIYNDANLKQTLMLFSPLLLFSMLAGFSLIRKSADFLTQLAEETEMVQAGRREEPVKINADKEMDDIADHFNAVFENYQKYNRELKEQAVQLMSYARDLSLSYAQRKEEEVLRNHLGRYVSNDLLQKLLNLKEGVFPESERKELTVLYADIRSFTALSEKMLPEDVVSMLNDFFSSMVDIIFKNNGVLDKFVGDQIMAVFGLLSTNQNKPAYAAVKTAMEMIDANRALMAKRSQNGKETFEIGIGINTGNAIIGNVGSENRMDYTVIGDSVNLAARLQGIAKGNEIVIGEKTFKQTAGHFPVEKKIRVKLKNKLEPVICYKI